MELSDILIKRRKELKLSLREAANKIGISHGYLDKLEKGYDPRTNTANKPTPETLALISKAYKLNYYELMIICSYIDLNELQKISGVSSQIIYRLFNIKALPQIENQSKEKLTEENFPVSLEEFQQNIKFSKIPIQEILALPEKDFTLLCNIINDTIKNLKEH